MKLIADPAELNIDVNEVCANPGVIMDIHNEVLRDLMQTPHAIERRHAHTGVRVPGQGGTFHHRRRVCV